METVRERHTLRTWTQPEMRWGVPASLVRALAKRRSGLPRLLLVRAGAGRLRPRTPSQFPPASAAPFDPPARPAVDERAPGRFQHATFHNADGGTRADVYDVPGWIGIVYYRILRALRSEIYGFVDT